MLKLFLGLLSLQFFLLSCLNNEYSSKNIIAISITTKIPERIVDNKGVFIIIDFYIFYNKEYIIYKLPYHKTYESDNKLIYDSLKYEFFVYKYNNKNGYLLKNANDSFRMQINKDSILKARAYGSNWDISETFKEVKIKGLNKLQNDSKQFIYKYIFENDIYDSAYFYYNNDLKNIRFTLSKSLDSTYNSKLYKTEFFLKHKSLSYGVELKDFYINSLEIKKIPFSNENDIINIFERINIHEKLKNK